MQVGAAYAEKLGRRRSDLDVYDAEEVNEKLAVKISGRANDDAVAPKANLENEASADQAEEENKAVKVVPAVKPPVEKTPAEKPAPKGKKADRQKLFEQIEADKAEQETPDYELPSLDLLLAGRAVLFRGAGKRSPPPGENPGKNLPRFRLQRPRGRNSDRPGHRPVRGRIGSRPAAEQNHRLADDLAIALRVPSVRIVAPIPGKNTVGIEVPNTDRQIVRLREVMEEANGKAAKMRIPLYLGKDVAGNPLVVDLTTLPHLLIAGRTGTGKSVCLNSIIVSMLMTRRPDEVRMLMIDPKMVELSPLQDACRT